MAEPGLRQLDQDLPRIDMYSSAFRARQALRNGKKPDTAKADKVSAKKPARRDDARDAVSLVDEARKVAEAIIADARAEADHMIADALTRIRTVISETLGAAGRAAAAEINPPLAPRVAVSDIIREVAARYHVRPQDITGANRSRHVIKARWAAMVAAHHARPDMSTIALGREFNRDHTAVIYALRKSGVRPIGEDV